MGKHKKKKKFQNNIPPLYARLGLKPDEWEISIHFTKGAVTGGRGVVVAVLHLPSGKKARRSMPAGTKAEARSIATELRQTLLAEVAKSL